jgi:lipoate-protein ligase B
MKSECIAIWLNRLKYSTAWSLQEYLANQIAAGEHPETLLLLEHPHSYTFGRSGHIENLIWDEDELARKGIVLEWTDRGGDVTYHGPGQLVGYPLLNLGTIKENLTGDSSRIPRADYLEYLRQLERMLILTLSRLGVPAFQKSGLTGVWIRPENIPQSRGQLPAKIAAIGVKIDAQGISHHGFALNVNPDMAYWEGIIGCGLEEYPVTSLAEISFPPPSVGNVIEKLIDSFGEVFNFKMVVKDLHEDRAIAGFLSTYPNFQN